MPRRRIISECKSPSCGAANPNVYDYNFSLLPEEVQKKLRALEIEGETLRKCSYCGDIWIEKTEWRNNSPRDRVIMVGIDNHVGGEGMVWPILR